jgi:hypothetical protein
MIFLMFFGLMVALIVWHTSGGTTARQSYLTSLEALRVDPNNILLRERALMLGRTYSRFTRTQYGVPRFGEDAIANDIDLAIREGLHRMHAFQAPAAPSPTGASVGDRLAELKRLFDQGLISAEEYSAQRTRILAEI